jgi:hypothetical protein
MQLVCKCCIIVSDDLLSLIFTHYSYKSFVSNLGVSCITTNSFILHNLCLFRSNNVFLTLYIFFVVTLIFAVLVKKRPPLRDSVFICMCKDPVVGSYFQLL